MSLLMLLGEFQFQTLADNLNAFDISTDARLADQDVMHRVPPVQSLGPGKRAIALDGTILPEHQGGLGQIEALHAAADFGLPRPLATGYGRFLGFYKIAKVQEKARYIAYAGLPRKIEFKIELLRSPIGFGAFGLF